MNKTAPIELHRTFLIEDLPAPLTRASSHIQLFDNYLPDTHLRLRSVRIPESREWTHILQQRTYPSEPELLRIKCAEIYLSNAEHERLQVFEGHEIRKNRYFHEFDGRPFAFDVYLGKLWGLNTARVEFATEDELRTFETPKFAVFEITNEKFFAGETLVGKLFADVQARVAGLSDELGSFSRSAEI